MGEKKVKKNRLIMGFVFLCLSIVALFLAINAKTTIGSSLFGLSGAFFGIGFKSIYDYFYWNKPERKGKYEEKLEEVNIASKDERLIRLREKSGKYSYLAGLIVSGISMWVFMILEWMNLLEFNRVLYIFLGSFIIFQLVIGIVIFNYLNKKY